MTLGDGDKEKGGKRKRYCLMTLLEMVVRERGVKNCLTFLILCGRSSYTIYCLHVFTTIYLYILVLLW